MLGYARDPGFRGGEVSGAEDDLWPVVGETLARLAESALSRGVLQGYTTREDSLTVMRGRLLMDRQMTRRPGTVLPLEVEFDEFEADVPENRILRTALHRMALVPRIAQPVRDRLRHLAARLVGARILVGGVALPAWRPTRLNERYQPALRMAELVVQGLGLDTADGDRPVASFVVNMATVFEDFVEVALRESFARLSTGRTVGQFATHLDELGRVPIRPDVVHVVQGRPALVLDAKYKLGYIDGGYPTADLYQLHSYCAAMDLDRGWLIYAGTRAEEARPSIHKIRNTRIEVVQWPLDVRQDARGLLRQVDRVASVAVCQSRGEPFTQTLEGLDG